MVLGETDQTFTQMRRGTLASCVLALLCEGDLYSFEITKILSEIEGLATSEGTIYPLLNRLSSENLVKSYWQESPDGPPRRYYRITKEGLAVLENFTNQWKVFTESVNSLLKELS